MDEGELQLVATPRNCTYALGHLPSSSNTPRTSIHSLPVELLTEIFGDLVPNGNCMDPEIPYLVSLTSVCRRWRQAVLNAPFLWSTIALINPKPFHIVMVQQWLERSKALPLTLALEIHPTSTKVRAEWDVVSKAMEEVLSTLIGHIHRWKSVRIFMQHFAVHPESPLLRLPSSPEAAPLLEEIDIIEKKCLTLETAEHIWKATGAYPSVRRVAWVTALDGPGSRLPRLVVSPWDRITHLKSKFVLDDVFFDFLMRCPTLKDLELGLLESTTSSLRRHHVCLPQLRRLALNSSVPTVTTQFVRHLEVPLLEYLKVQRWYSAGDWIDLFGRSSCQLKIIWVGDSSSCDEGFKQLLVSPAMAYLEELVASLSYHADGIFRILTWSAGARYLPLLRRIDMSVGGFASGSLSQMLNSRIRDAFGTLDDLNFKLGIARTSGDISVDLRFLDRLREEGFNVRYS